MWGLRLDTHNRARHLDEHYIKGEITFEELMKYKKPNKNQKIMNKIEALKKLMVPKMAAIEEYKETTTVDVARNKRDIAQLSDKLAADNKKLAEDNKRMAEELKKNAKDLEYLRRELNSQGAIMATLIAYMKSEQEKNSKKTVEESIQTNSS